MQRWFHREPNARFLFELRVIDYSAASVLLRANQNGENIVVFRIDHKSRPVVSHAAHSGQPAKGFHFEKWKPFCFFSTR